MKTKPSDRLGLPLVNVSSLLLSSRLPKPSSILGRPSSLRPPPPPPSSTLRRPSSLRPPSLSLLLGSSSLSSETLDLPSSLRLATSWSPPPPLLCSWCSCSLPLFCLPPWNPLSPPVPLSWWFSPPPRTLSSPPPPPRFPSLPF